MIAHEKKLLLTSKLFSPSFDKWVVVGAFNPAAVRLPNKKIMLYVRVAESFPKGKVMSCPVISSPEHFITINENIPVDKIREVSHGVLHLHSGECRLTSMSHFRPVILNKDGMSVDEVIDKPAFTGTAKEGHYGVEDPRIVKIGNLYYMTYVTISTHDGVCANLAVSKDLKKWKREGIIFSEQNKDVVLFPNKIKGKFVALHRPEGFFEFSKPSIWISYSPDIIYWGKERSIIQPRKRTWECDRVGAGAPPIKTSKGWLEIYHGVKTKGDRRVYSAGAVLFDLKNPEKIIARSPPNQPLLKPNRKWEKNGFVNDVIFPTGAVLDLNKKDLLIYSGGSDSVTSVTKVALKDVFKQMVKVK
ncbi:hypothetical protein CL622_05480 [archaeon]|nr:hypothetical protein [archaeon]|tara:strand:- start:1103 stop:2179 length:1077 start_codon:yes stop_codon:yes gene_type:complete